MMLRYIFRFNTLNIIYKKTFVQVHFSVYIIGYQDFRIVKFLA